MTTGLLIWIALIALILAFFRGATILRNDDEEERAADLAEQYRRGQRIVSEMDDRGAEWLSTERRE